MPNYAERITEEANELAGAVRLANATTGAEDTGIVDAVATLIAGYGGGGDEKSIEISHTLTEDFTTQATTLLATLQTPAIQAFFDETFGVRSQFDTTKKRYYQVSMTSDVQSAVGILTSYEAMMVTTANAAAQFGSALGIVIGYPKTGGSESVQQGTTYSIRPQVSNISGGVWKIEIFARCANGDPVKVYKAGTYRWKIKYLYSTNL